MRSLRILIALALLMMGGGVTRADSPLSLPEEKNVCSLNGLFCARMDPARKETTVYRHRSGGIQEKLWSMPGWFRVAALTNDGEHLVTGYDGANLLPLNYRKDEIMLSFYKRGVLIRSVRLNEMTPDTSKLVRTVSHYHWGNYLGLNEEDHYTVELVDKRLLLFDAKTGLPLVPIHKRSQDQK